MAAEQIKFLNFTIPLLILLSGATSFAKETMVIWHTFDVQPAAVLAKHIKAFSVGKDIEVRLETGMDVVQSLMNIELVRDIPAAVIGPSDMIGHATAIGLIPVQQLAGIAYTDGIADLVRMDGKTWGYPLLWGNHLLLYYNKKSPPMTRVKESVAGAVAKSEKLAMQSGEPYIFLMLLLGQLRPEVTHLSADQITVPMLSKALTEYKKLNLSGAVVKDCSYHCATRDFYQGDWQQAINGDWSLIEAETKMGEQLGLAALPAFNGINWRSPCASFALMVTRSVKNDRNKQKFLRELATFLSSEGPQKVWFDEARRIPVNKAAQADLRKNATGNHKILFDELSRAVCILPDYRISAMWPAIRKGLRLYSSGVKSADDTARYILQLSN